MHTTKEQQINRQYVRNFLISMVAYALTLMVCLWAITQIETTWIKWVLAVAPVIPILFALRVLVRYLAQIDELQQRMQLQAFAFAAGATAIVTFTLGLLENVGFPQMSLVWVLPMIVAFWGIANVWYGRRYA